MSTPSRPSFLNPAEIAQLELRGSHTSWDELQLHIVESPADPWFDVGYRIFDEEFGATGEVEQRDVLARRLKGVLRPTGDCTILYHMMLLLHRGECVAVRDHLAVYLAGASDVVVRFSHSFVMPAWRRQGLSRILHVLPERTGRACAAAAGRPDVEVKYIAEMMVWDPADAASVGKSLALEKTGFMKIDPRLGYSQPDFRPAEVIDATGGPQLVRLDFLMRRFPHEEKRSILRSELCHLIRCIHCEYAMDCRPDHMRPCFEWLRQIETTGPERYALFRPTETVA